MRKLSILVAASAMLFAACSKEDSTIQNLADGKFYASSAVSRTTMGDNGTSVHWVDGDLVTIFNKTTDNLQYKATSVNGTTAELVYAAGVRGAATMQENFALYPYDANATLNSGVISTSIPAAQTSEAGANLHHSIMVAKTADNSFSFANATALLRFDVKSVIGGATIKSIAIQSEAKGLAGDVTIDLNAEKPVAVVANGAAKEIVLDCGNAALSTSEYTSFYAVLPATEFAAGDLKIVYTVNVDGADVDIEYPVQSAMSLGAGAMKWTQYTIVPESFDGTTSDMATAAINEMKSVFANGGEYTLGVDVALSETLTVDGDVTLNLNGYDLDASASTSRPFNVKNGTLTINAGTSTVKVGNYGLVNILADAQNVEVILNGGDYKGNTDNGSFIKPRGTGEISITLNDVTYTDSSNDGYVCDAQAYKGDDEDLTISVTGGSFKAAGGFCGLTPGSSIKDAIIETSGTELKFPAVEGTGKGTNSLIENSTITSAGYAVTTGHGADVKVKDCVVNGGEYAYFVFPTGGRIIVEEGYYVGALDIHKDFESNANASVNYSGITVDGVVMVEKTR